uniref:Uncharacterized protein n=1 Tax=Arundo donax TaxID=35708 RepID=A0A0A9G409_ARUDO
MSMKGPFLLRGCSRIVIMILWFISTVDARAFAMHSPGNRKQLIVPKGSKMDAK